MCPVPTRPVCLLTEQSLYTLNLICTHMKYYSALAVTLSELCLNVSPWLSPSEWADLFSVQWERTENAIWCSSGLSFWEHKSFKIYLVPTREENRSFWILADLYVSLCLLLACGWSYRNKAASFLCAYIYVIGNNQDIVVWIWNIFLSLEVIKKLKVNVLKI